MKTERNSVRDRNPISQYIPTDMSSVNNKVIARLEKKTKMYFISDAHLNLQSVDGEMINLMIDTMRSDKKAGYAVEVVFLGDILSFSRDLYYTNRAKDDIAIASRYGVRNQDKETWAANSRLAANAFFKRIEDVGAKIFLVIIGNEDRSFYAETGIDPYGYFSGRKDVKITDDSCDLIVKCAGSKTWISCHHQINAIRMSQSGPTVYAAIQRLDQCGVLFEDGEFLRPDMLIHGHRHYQYKKDLPSIIKGTGINSYAENRFFIGCPSLLNTGNYGLDASSRPYGLHPVSSGCYVMEFDKGPKEPMLLAVHKKWK